MLYVVICIILLQNTKILQDSLQSGVFSLPNSWNELYVKLENRWFWWGKRGGADDLRRYKVVACPFRIDLKVSEIFTS